MQAWSDAQVDRALQRSMSFKRRSRIYLQRPTERPIHRTVDILQVRAGLGRGTRGEIALTLGGLRRSGIDRLGHGLFGGCFHLCFRRRLWWLRVSLGSYTRHLSVDKLVAVGMNPNSLHQ